VLKILKIDNLNKSVEFIIEEYKDIFILSDFMSLFYEDNYIDWEFVFEELSEKNQNLIFNQKIKSEKIYKNGKEFILIRCNGKESLQNTYCILTY
jgi:hypothetical protein